MKNYFTIPNIICYFRVLLCFYSCYFFLETQSNYLFSALIIIVIALDGLDGIAARLLNQATPLGAKIDILADRITELVYWIFFAYLGYIAYWVFAYFLVRGSLVDWISFKTDKPLGDSWLRSSRFMRAGYGTLKVLSFILLAAFPSSIFTIAVVYITVLVNFLRAYPVLRTFFK